MFHLTFEKMTDKQPHNSETTTVSSEKLRAPPAVPSLILINLAVRQFSEVCKYLHQAEEETSVKRPHAPLPDTKGVCGRSRAEFPLSAFEAEWISMVQPSHHLHTMGYLSCPQRSTDRAIQLGHLSTHIFFRCSLLKAVFFIAFVLFLSIVLKKIKFCSR